MTTKERLDDFERRLINLELRVQGKLLKKSSPVKSPPIKKQNAKKKT
jgi:hypothetical protein